jgi:hypothetical protein
MNTTQFCVHWVVAQAPSPPPAAKGAAGVLLLVGLLLAFLMVLVLMSMATRRFRTSRLAKRTDRQPQLPDPWQEAGQRMQPPDRV